MTVTKLLTRLPAAVARALFEWETGGYYWPGTLDVVLSADADGAALLEQIKADWSAKSGWTVRDKTSVNGDPELVIVSEEGYRHAIAFTVERNALHVLSSSACFQMSGTPEPGVYYWTPDPRPPKPTRGEIRRPGS